MVHKGISLFRSKQYIPFPSKLTKIYQHKINHQKQNQNKYYVTKKQLSIVEHFDLKINVIIL